MRNILPHSCASTNPQLLMLQSPLFLCPRTCSAPVLPRSRKNLPCSSNPMGTSCCLCKPCSSLRGMMLQLYHCLLFISLGTPAIHFPIKIQAPFRSHLIREEWFGPGRSQSSPTQQGTTACSLLAWLHNPSVANFLREGPPGGGTTPQGCQSTGIPAGGRQLLQLAATRDGTNPSPQSPRAGSAPPKLFLQFSTGQSSQN